MFAAQWAELAGFFKSIAYILTAVAALAVGAATLVAVVGGRKLSAHIKTKLADLDMAVNGVDKDAGERPLIDKVRLIEERQTSVVGGMSAIIRTLDRICTHLHIPTHSQEEKAA